jgi:hypothetical protein
LISNDATGQKNARTERSNVPSVVVQTITLPKLHAELTVKEVHNLTCGGILLFLRIM